jgi:hypothetical protein
MSHFYTSVTIGCWASLSEIVLRTFINLDNLVCRDCISFTVSLCLASAIIIAHYPGFNFMKLSLYIYRYTRLSVSFQILCSPLHHLYVHIVYQSSSFCIKTIISFIGRSKSHKKRTKDCRYENMKGAILI